MAQVSVTFGAGAFSAKLYVQPGAVGTVVPLTNAQLGSQDLATAAAASTQITAIIIPANQLIVEEIGNFGYENAEATFPQAGNRFQAKVATASAPSSLTLTFALNPSSTTFQTLTQASLSGTDVRTYVIDWLVGGNNFVYAFNAFASATGYNFQTNAEAKGIITLVPQGGGTYGYSFV
jgi:hypothetical protein